MNRPYLIFCDCRNFTNTAHPILYIKDNISHFCYILSKGLKYCICPTNLIKEIPDLVLLIRRDVSSPPNVIYKNKRSSK